MLVGVVLTLMIIPVHYFCVRVCSWQMCNRLLDWRLSVSTQRVLFLCFDILLGSYQDEANDTFLYAQ